MNLLTDGIAQEVVFPTQLTRKLTIDGVTSAYPVYRVRLDQLYYNDQNDRISTWISKYKAEHDDQGPSTTQRDDYNKLIETFIVESNPDSIRKTQNNIELVDQREPGVVLVDGRVIDGNRRFTCLRRLAAKNDKFNYFETVILDRNIESSAKQIKLLELSIQHGEESKVDYNPIDRLVGIYNDIIDTKMLSVEEYARSTNESVAEVRHKVELANLMIDFLDFINAPKQFYLARDMELYSSLDELSKLLRKCHTEDEKADLKNSVYCNILMNTQGDMARFLRRLKTIVDSDHRDDFFAEQNDLAVEVLDMLPTNGKVTIDTIRDDVRTNLDVRDSLARSVEKAEMKTKKAESLNRPIQLAEKATNFIDEIDTHIFDKMNDSDLQRLKKQLGKLTARIQEIEELI
ncbi:MAG: hypothetical protein UE643_02490 [Gemmiger sp.]|nr:hypothetical protein [Gemmiger sp.]